MRRLIAVLLLALATPAAANCQFSSGEWLDIDIYFGPGTAGLSGTGAQSVDAILRQAAECDVMLVVSAHLDAADVAVDPGLGQKRIDAVRSHIVKRGVPATRIAVRDVAFDEPVRRTAEGVREPQNRRVTLTVVVR